MERRDHGEGQRPDRSEVRPQAQSPPLDYDAEADWINQRQLADLLGIAPETASRWAGTGKLGIFEHGMIGAGHRKYSRQLVREYQALKIQQAQARMRNALGKDGTSARP